MLKSIQNCKEQLCVALISGGTNKAMNRAGHNTNTVKNQECGNLSTYQAHWTSFWFSLDFNTLRYITITWNRQTQSLHMFTSNSQQHHPLNESCGNARIEFLLTSSSAMTRVPKSPAVKTVNFSSNIEFSVNQWYLLKKNPGEKR